MNDRRTGAPLCTESLFLLQGPRHHAVFGLRMDCVETLHPCCCIMHARRGVGMKMRRLACPFQLRCLCEVSPSVLALQRIPIGEEFRGQYV